MTMKDKLEIGLKEDAPYRKDNLPSQQVRGPLVSSGPGRSPEVPLARTDATDAGGNDSRPARGKRGAKVPGRPAPTRHKAR